MNPTEARAQFTIQLQRDEASTTARLELDRAALLIAAENYPALDVEQYLQQLDELAAQARANDAPHASPVTRILRLNDLMYGEWGFHGNADDYYDARNSFLNDVIDRRTGIPITLAVVYLEIARRLGLTLSGVGMPGHFIVKYQDTDEELFIDPFNEGRLLSEEDCFRMILQMYQGRVVFERRLLDAVTKRQILARMLQNLKGIYARAHDHAKTLSAIERVMLIHPAAEELRDRGLVLAALHRYPQAIADLESYLRTKPEPDEAKAIQEKLKELKQRQAQWN
ncbi:MAG: tetratricopeptide repeat protein [Acidobacteria bacterium]|nr:tetratricopeptide repeat protein [Acidobacteriota bacterium]